MKKSIYQILTIKLSTVLFVIFGNVFSITVFARADTSKLILSLPFKQCWSRPAAITDRIFASDNEVDIIGPTLSGKLLAMELTSGKKLWETELGGAVVSDLIDDRHKKNIFVVTKAFSNREEDDDNYKNLPGFSGGSGNKLTTINLRSISKTAGITNWQTPFLTIISEAETRVSIFINDGKIITVDQSGNMTVFNETTGEVLWNKSLNLELSNTQFDLQNKNLVIFSKNKIISVELETGKYIFQKEINSNLTAAYLFSNNLLIVGNKKGEVFAVETYTKNTKNTKKSVWRFRSGAEVSNISFTPKGLLVTSFDNFVYLIAPENGEAIWKRRFEGRLSIEPYLYENYLVVITLSGSKAYILDINTGKAVNQIVLNGDNYFVNRPVLKNRFIVFPTARGIFAFTNSNNKCVSE